jgi:hypothetical protein
MGATIKETAAAWGLFPAGEKESSWGAGGQTPEAIMAKDKAVLLKSAIAALPDR